MEIFSEIGGEKFFGPPKFGARSPPMLLIQTALLHGKQPNFELHYEFQVPYRVAFNHKMLATFKLKVIKNYQTLPNFKIYLLLTLECNEWHNLIAGLIFFKLVYS